jgi:hypothetical protein
MWMVTTVHFATTIFVIWKLCHFAIAIALHQEPPWCDYLQKVFLLFQPQFPLSIHVMDMLNIPSWIVLTLSLGSIPIWSICFGWLFVKFDNWLNHFPVLGRKVI